MTDKKHDPQRVEAVPLALASPPSHPTALGNVWAGETRPSATNFAAALQAEVAQWSSSDKPGNG